MAKLTGTNPEQVPTNADLGTMAYQDKDNVNVGSFTSNGIDDNATSTAMTLDSSGNVQISGDLTGVRLFDVYNTGSTSTDGAVIRLITEQAGSTSTTSGDLLKRKNGEFRMVNYDTDAGAYIAFNVGSSERMKIASNGEVQVTSGLLELDGNDIGGTQVTIADDAVASITPPRNGGFMFITDDGNGSFPSTVRSGFVFYDVGGSLNIQKQTTVGTVGDSINVSTSDVTGTTGSDGFITVAVQTGVIKIENRAGLSKTYQITFL